MLIISYFVEYPDFGVFPTFVLLIELSFNHSKVVSLIIFKMKISVMKRVLCSATMMMGLLSRSQINTRITSGIC